MMIQTKSVRDTLYEELFALLPEDEEIKVLSDFVKDDDYGEELNRILNQENSPSVILDDLNNYTPTTDADSASLALITSGLKEYAAYLKSFEDNMHNYGERKFKLAEAVIGDGGISLYQLFWAEFYQDTKFGEKRLTKDMLVNDKNSFYEYEAMQRVDFEERDTAYMQGPEARGMFEYLNNVVPDPEEILLKTDVIEREAYQYYREMLTNRFDNLIRLNILEGAKEQLPLDSFLAYANFWCLFLSEDTKEDYSITKNDMINALSAFREPFGNIEDEDPYDKENPHEQADVLDCDDALKVLKRFYREQPTSDDKFDGFSLNA